VVKQCYLACSNQAMTHTLVLMLAFLFANLPWLSKKLFLCISLRGGRKPLGWCVFELIALYFLFGLLVMYVENVTFGNVAKQNWEFYAVTTSLFVVFAFPGFIYNTLWK